MGHESTAEDQRRAIVIGVLYVALAIALAYMLFKIWPPTPWPTDANLKKDEALVKLMVACECRAAQATATATASPSPSPSPSPPPTETAETTAGPGTTTNQTETPTPTPTPTPGPSPTPSDALATMPMSFYFIGCLWTSFDERLLLLVIVAGMLGSFVHGATSLADYIGNNSFSRSWTWFYLLRPVIGMALALVFYFVIRGGFLTTSGGARDINPYGIAALAGLVGMFSKQATDKLSEVFGTLFRSAPGEGDAKRDDPLKPTTTGGLTLDPSTTTAGAATFKLTVTGTGFVDGAIIRIDDQPQVTTFESSTSLSAQVKSETIAEAGTLKVTVFNPDGTRFGPVDFTVTDP